MTETSNIIYTEQLSIKVPKEKVKKADTVSVSEMRKKFKWRYKDGEIVITEYIGDEEILTLPEKIGNKYVTGIGKQNGLGYFPGGKNVKKVIIPGWITMIEPESFEWCMHDTEIIFEEGGSHRYLMDYCSNLIELRFSSREVCRK